MTEALSRFMRNISEGHVCITNYDVTSHHFTLRHVWVVSIASLDLYMTDLVAETGLRLIEKMATEIPRNLGQVEVPLSSALLLDTLSETQKLVFFRDHIFLNVQFKSFYKPDKISEALGYIWLCPGQEKWSRITARMKSTGRYTDRTERDIRDELTLIGDRRDLIAHSADTHPGRLEQNTVSRADAQRVVQFVTDLSCSIDAETESQLE